MVKWPRLHSRMEAVPSPWLWVLLLLLVLGLHALWEGMDDTPAGWDMAYHQIQGYRHLEAVRSGRLLQQLPQLSSYYPPFYYLQEALVLSLLPGTGYLAFWSNLLGLVLLSWATFRLAARVMDPVPAQLTGILVLLFPLVAWTSRFSLLDVSLAGWVAAAAWLIVESELLQKRRLVPGMALVFSAGALTKWTFVAFLFFPLLFALVDSPDRRRSLLNLADAALLAIPPVFWWYLPNLKALMVRFQGTVEAGVWEGDPGLGSVLGWIYYPRILSSYYLFLPLTLAAAGALWWVFGSGASSRREVKFLGCWLLGGMFVMTLLEAKDPRYIMPVASPLAIFLMLPWRTRPRTAMALLGFALLQFLTVSFAVPGLPARLALFQTGEHTDYRSMRQEWVLYQTHYFDVAGPPRQEEWGYRRLVERLREGARVGFVPDSLRFNPLSLQLAALQGGKVIEVVRLGDGEDSIQLLSSVEFVVGKTGDQGLSYITRYNARIYRQLERLNWPLEQTWKLPDQTQALLWRNPTPSP